MTLRKRLLAGIKRKIAENRGLEPVGPRTSSVRTDLARRYEAIQNVVQYRASDWIEDSWSGAQKKAIRRELEKMHDDGLIELMAGDTGRVVAVRLIEEPAAK